MNFSTLWLATSAATLLLTALHPEAAKLVAVVGTLLTMAAGFRVAARL